MKLSSKIHLYSSVLMAVILIVMNLCIYYVFSKMSLDSQLKQAEVEASSIARGMAHSAAAIPVGDLLRSYVPADGKIQFVPADSKVKSPFVTSSGEEMEGLKLPYNTNKQVKQISYEGMRYVMVSMPVIWSDGAVYNIQISRSLAATMETLQALRIVLVAVTAIGLVPIVVSTRVLGRLIMQPITGLTHTMQDIRQSGRFRRIELKEKSKDELVEMGAAFNDMITLLESNHAKQEQFVSNASHELKTPLTIIESYASLLKRRGMDRPELFMESVEAIHSEAIRMKEMTEQLLLLARNQEQWQVEMEQVDLVALSESSARAFRDAYNRTVEIKADGEVLGWTDSRRLKQLLFILLDNARKYSDEHMIIEIGNQSSEAYIRVIDRGIGITKDELEHVFDRFYRVDEARGRRGGGAGLGLSLAKDIAAAISAVVELDSLPGVGTTATIRMRASQ
ncbi:MULTISPECIES: cell wall metabolism sensor histidine kinase WalK [Paenibacillus]|uniref:sensor histidine kinase n=1 Tax=Paenibacillus TaxID=44249 RepID=UPI00116380D3|nr:HAMP domain-containing sensor histidine kinase [Paenibacillus sp. Cedars]AWP30630.1 two-component sensor histidine kinase [Paenibacillus sp. Cedars]